MIITDKQLLASYRVPGKCQWCGKSCPMLCGAHVFSKGSGRIDLPWNLVSLGMDPFRDCTCHQDSHYEGWPGTDELLAINAVRFDCLQTDLREMRDWVLRQPKRTPVSRLEEALEDLSPRARQLMRETLFVKLAEVA